MEFRLKCAYMNKQAYTECAKKWPNLFLSELRQICTKFDNYSLTDSQDDRIM